MFGQRRRKWANIKTLVQRIVWRLGLGRHTQQTQDITQCWTTVYNAGPTLVQHYYHAVVQMQTSVKAYLESQLLLPCGSCVPSRYRISPCIMRCFFLAIHVTKRHLVLYIDVEFDTIF